MTGIPKNVKEVLDSEADWRIESFKEIEKTIELQDHLNLIDNAINVCMLISVYRKHMNEDEETLRNLGVRLGNDYIAALNLTFAGYYHVVSMLLRTIEECSLLLYYFAKKPSDIPIWKKSTRKEIHDKFNQRVLRSTFEELLKEKGANGIRTDLLKVRYQFYSEYGTHPTAESNWRLFYKDGGIAVGPFYDDKRLDAILYDLASKGIFAIVGLVSAFGKNNLSQDILDTFNYFVGVNEAWQKKYGERAKEKDTDNVKKILRE